MHTNKLINETSPYLLQHAHNPVNWYPWGDEAFEMAYQENKPILISIGYAACHWCHVMEKESFENEETASIMNNHFINIKIDREERPDLDHIYMDAVQAITGSGGWPLHVFLTADRKPFYGGTYFPPKPMYNKISWKNLLQNISKAYTEKQSEIYSQANQLTEHLLKSNSFHNKNQTHSSDDWENENLQLITEKILQQADTEWGGFGKAPKFPQTLSILYLLRQYHFSKDESALQQALLSLDKMIDGGIYDQIGGGFSRYSTDEKWLVPHFEKMLYDNALLITVLSEAFQITHNSRYEEVIHQTIAFIRRELMSTDFAFYSSLDADSEGVEGKFYTWSITDITHILAEDAAIFCKFYNVTELGNWENTNILFVQQSVEQFAQENNLDVLAVREKLESCRNKLLQVRNKRVRPLTDDKILLGWNALANIACSKAYQATGQASYLQLAIDNIRFLEKHFKFEDGWRHTYKNNIAKIPAFLDDYAFLIQAYIQLQQVSGNLQYLLKAKVIAKYVEVNFLEEASGFLYYTHQNQTDIIVRKKEIYDGATPSGNAIMMLNFYQLSIIFDKSQWKQLVYQSLHSVNEALLNYPVSFGMWALILQQIIEGTKEIIIAGNESEQHVKQIQQLYLPNAIILSSRKEEEQFPIFKGKFKVGITSFYFCKNYVCSEPLYDLVNFLQLCNS